MKLSFALVLSIIVAVGLVVIGFTFYQISAERSKLNNELEIRANLITEAILRSDTAIIDATTAENIEKVVNNLEKRYNFLGMAIYYNRGSIICNYAVRPFINKSLDFITQSTTADTAFGTFIKSDREKIYLYLQPVKKEYLSNSVLIIYMDASYIDNIVGRIWLSNFFRWFLQALLVSFVTVLILQWGILSPVNKIVLWAKEVRFGNPKQFRELPSSKFLGPLYKEIAGIAKALYEAKASAEEEAKLRATAEAIWTPERLKIEMKNILHDKRIIVVSNREPYMHVHEGREIKCIVPASGMITAMEPILKACGGLWIASGSGDADREMADDNHKLGVPPENPMYTLKRIILDKEEEEHYYYGFSNEGLWPLCHIAHTRPTFRKEDWDFYQKVNMKFARAVVEETTGEEDPYILIQDYHFALLPQMIRKLKPKAKIAIFWHIPWPNPESFGICPWQKEILNGMLGADLIGFHTQYHCNHFLETASQTLEARILWENFSIRKSGQTTLVKPFPISIAFTMKDHETQSNDTDINSLLRTHNLVTRYSGIGVDRIDYTKGIIEKFLAVERFLEKYPDFIGQFTFIQIGAPSRTFLKTYADMVTAVEMEAQRINQKFATTHWKPILLLIGHHSHEEINPYYSAADLCMVTSLHDGMNLVAKEFIASRSNLNGTLILSRFAGASQELTGAIIVNPYDIERTADAIKYAIEMPQDEQFHRMRQMRQKIMENNIYLWAADLLRKLADI